MGELNNSELVKLQIKTISQLQDKINLLEFDVSANLREISRLKYNETRRKETITKVRDELLKMSKTNDYSKVGYLLKTLNTMEAREYEQE